MALDMESSRSDKSSFRHCIKSCKWWKMYLEAWIPSCWVVIWNKSHSKDMVLQARGKCVNWVTPCFWHQSFNLDIFISGESAKKHLKMKTEESYGYWKSQDNNTCSLWLRSTISTFSSLLQRIPSTHHHWCSIQNQLTSSIIPIILSY